MRRLLGAFTVFTLVAGCTGVAQTPAQTPSVAEPSTSAGSMSAGPTATIEPVATTIEATAGTASTGPGMTSKPAATVKPRVSPVPTPKPTPVPSVPPLDHPDLRYLLVDALGRPLFCDPDFYPVARADEASLAQQYLTAIQADAPTYAAIRAHLGVAPSLALNPDEVLAIYREWKMLRALRLTEADGRFGFDYIAAATSSAETGWHVVGTIDPAGGIVIDRRDPSGPPPCPICLARGTRIATPEGERAVEDVRAGMAVWTTDEMGRQMAGWILKVGSTPVPATHEVVHLVLSDGRTVEVSPGHRLPDGRRLGDLRAGAHVDGATVTSAVLKAYDGGATFDLLPSGPTGTYWANGILLATTIAR